MKQTLPLKTTTPNPKRGKRKVQRDPATPDLLGKRLFLRVQEYAQLSGTPAPTVYSLIQKKVIPSVRIGNGVRIPVSALKALVAA